MWNCSKWLVRRLTTIALAAATVGQAATLTYPGPVPCDTTLAACIGAAGDGGTVKLATNGTIDEGVSLNDQSLTLEAAAGFTPQLGAGNPFQEVYIQQTGPPTTVTVRGLRLPFGAFEINTSGTSHHTITVSGCQVTNSYPGSNARGFLIDLRAPTTLVVENNDVISNGYPFGLTTAIGSGAVEVTVAANRFRKTSVGLSATGIDLDLRGAFVVTANIWSNVVSDVADCGCGGATAVDISTSDTVSATLNLVNNTIDLSGAGGIRIGTPAIGQLLVANIFNNIVTRTATGLSLPAAVPRLTVNNGNNDFFNNTTNTSLGGYVAGPGTVIIDPLFVNLAARDYHLQGTSTLVNFGLNSPPGGLSTLDADGNLRVAGPSVDLGAYERNSSPPTTTSTTTTTTSTTLPMCVAEASYASAACRLTALETAVAASVPPGSLATQLEAALTASRTAVETARQQEAAAKKRPRRQALSSGIRALGSFGHRLASRKARILNADTRNVLGAAAAAIRIDLKTLRRQ